MNKAPGSGFLLAGGLVVFPKSTAPSVDSG
nr:MAG TPA: hypothetical protein [Caudoviricetes sp.]